MLVKLFVLGLPGSGKSAIARYILDCASHQLVDEQNDQRWSTIRFNDYAILNGMFRQDIAGERFKPTESGGFDVLKLEVFDEALQVLEQKVNAYIHSLKLDEKKLVLIEFSRNNYKRAFQQFNKSFLKNTYLLYLRTEIEVCKKRIRDRVANPQFEEDDFNVSDYIFDKYYHADDWEGIADVLEKDYGVNREHLWTYDNNLSYETACLDIEPFVKKILVCLFEPL